MKGANVDICYNGSMNVGDRFTTKLRVPHRVDATILALERDAMLVDHTHRCTGICWLYAYRDTLPIDGVYRERYDTFAQAYVQVPEGAIPLPGAR